MAIAMPVNGDVGLPGFHGNADTVDLALYGVGKCAPRWEVKVLDTFAIVVLWVTRTSGCCRRPLKAVCNSLAPGLGIEPPWQRQNNKRERFR
ncbi:MAG TPA: hypothetical protein VIR57_19815 [Chloroflexota bacterium]